MNVLITGVSKGIGLALTTEALQKGHHVFGVARKPDESKELMQLQKEYKTLTIIGLDLTNDDAQEKLNKALKATDKIDISLRYEHFNDFPVVKNNVIKEGLGQISLRLAYGFKL